MCVCVRMRAYACVGDLGVRALKKPPKSGKCSARDVCASGVRVDEGCRFVSIVFFFCFFVSWAVRGSVGG